MAQGIKSISLVLKHGADLPKRIGDSLSTCLRRRGVSVSEGRVDPSSDAVVVLGGDGTLLRVAGQVFQLRLPLLGINLGGLGFLTEIHTDEMEGALEHLLSGDFELDRRMMLAIRITSGEDPQATFFALNEAVVTKGALARIITLPTWVNRAFLTTYRGDGLILSSPTGSTAYNLSAGGPILHPSLEALVLTPICPFALSARPLILPGDAEVEIQIQRGADEVSLVVDGQVGRDLRKGATLRVGRAEGHLLLIKSPLIDYFSILREKLGWAKGMGM